MEFTILVSDCSGNYVGNLGTKSCQASLVFRMDPVGKDNNCGLRLHVDHDGRPGVAGVPDAGLRVEYVTPGSRIPSVLVPAKSPSDHRVILDGGLAQDL